MTSIAGSLNEQLRYYVKVHPTQRIKYIQESIRIYGRFGREFRRSAGYVYISFKDVYASFNTFWISLRPSSCFQNSSVSSSLDKSEACT